MKYAEHVITFGCEQETLVGILAVPEDSAGLVGVVMIVGGPQYRVGSHRQFVLLSRVLAAAGFPVLRFDYRGMGDSTGSQQVFENVSNDISKAIDTMQSRIPSIKSLVLWGLCDGASAALLYHHHQRDERISGLCLLNPWVRSEVTLARTHVRHYYGQRLMQKEFWEKLARGKVSINAMMELLQRVWTAARPTKTRATELAPTFQQRMAIAWADFKGDILLILSGEDYTAKEFIDFATTNADWAGLTQRPSVNRHHLENADHTFSSSQSRSMVESLTVDWLRRFTASSEQVAQP